MRRRPGAAFEQCPSEKVGYWFSENLFRVISSLISVGFFCLAVNITVDKFFNFLATDGKDVIDKPYTSHSPTVDAVKLVGSLIIVYLICKKKRQYKK